LTLSSWLERQEQALGAHVLDQYQSKENLKKTSCRVRGANQHVVFDRVDKTLSLRLLSPLGSNNDAATENVAVLPAVRGEPHLGLDKTTYSRIAEDITRITHVVCSVSFRIKPRNFVDDIAGVTNLIHLALASARSRHQTSAFCSSIASVMAVWRPRSGTGENVEDQTAADGHGHSRSKWVAQQICKRVSQNTKLNGHIKVFRVWQLSGDPRHGVCVCGMPNRHGQGC